MLPRVNKNGSTRPRYMKHDPVQKMRQHLAWAIGSAAIVLIVNAVTVVALV